MQSGTVAVIGAGNGGKAVAVDMALHGRTVRLFEFPEYAQNLAALQDSPVLRATGVLAGQARLAMVTTDLAQAVKDVEMLMVCTQAPAHRRVAEALAPLVKPEQTVVICPGSTGGSLEFAHVFRQAGVTPLPVLAELHTLPYGCRAAGNEVHVSLKVAYVLYGALPAGAIAMAAPLLEDVYPGLVRGVDVMQTALTNANPVIHPPIALLNVGGLENRGAQMRFYKDGVSRSVARLIRLLDRERMALLKALGYAALSDPEACVKQGYAESADYFQCYNQGRTFVGFASPDTIDHRYFHEDVGMGLVLYSSLGAKLGIPVPVSAAVVRMASVVVGRDYFMENRRSLAAFGCDQLSVPELKAYLASGRIQARG